jgi:hypothetical protein
VIDSLDTLLDGWHVVAISHIWYDYSISALPDYALNVLSVFDAYNSRSAGTITHNSTAFSYDFTEAGGNVEFCIGGHVHADQVYYSAGGIPIIITDTDSFVRKTAEQAVEGTITEGCIDAVVADYDVKKLKLVRIGRGSDRTITLPTYGEAEIVNILNTYDIQYNKRFSPTGMAYKDAAGMIAFAIPWADVWNKTIYFKGFSDLRAATSSTSDWYIVKDGLSGVGDFLTNSADSRNVFFYKALNESNGVYCMPINSSTLSDPANYANADRLQIQMVLNSTGTAITAADLANCIMTIDQPID